MATAISLGGTISRVKFFDYDTPNVLGLLDAINTGAPSVTDVMVSVPNWQLASFTASKLSPLLSRYPGGRFTFQIALGNEPNHPGTYQSAYAGQLEAALDAIHANLPGLQATVAFSFDAFEVSYPPEQGKLSDGFLAEFGPVLAKCDFFTINTYSYFAASNADIPRSALYGPGVAVMDNSIKAVKAALARAGTIRGVDVTNKPIVLGETGWPSAPSGGDRSVANAQAFYTNTAAWIESNPDLVAGYMFEAFDENQKTGPEEEKNFGILKADGTPKW
jgi:hypothetical protein